MQFKRFRDYSFTSQFPVAILPPFSTDAWTWQHCSAECEGSFIRLSWTYRHKYPYCFQTHWTPTFTHNPCVWCRIMNVHWSSPNFWSSPFVRQPVVVLPWFLCLQNNAKPHDYTRPDTNISLSYLRLVHGLHWRSNMADVVDGVV